MKSKLWAALAVANLLALSGAAQAQDLQKIRVAVGAKGLGESVVTEAAQKQGFFKDRGLDVEVFYTSGSGETMQTVIGGSAEFGVATGLLGVIGAYGKGAPVRIVGASFTGDSNLFWYVRADSDIEKPEDAAGRSVTFSTNGSSAHNVVLEMQKHLGVEFEQTATGPAPATFTQVMSGQVDVGWSGAPFAVEAIEEGKVRQIWRASDVPALAGQTSRVVITRPDTLEKDPALVEKFMAGYREAVDWLYDSPDGAKFYAEWAGVPVPVAERTLADYVTREGTDPDEIHGLKPAMESAVGFGYLPGPLDEAKLDALVQIPPRKD